MISMQNLRKTNIIAELNGNQYFHWDSLQNLQETNFSIINHWKSLREYKAFIANQRICNDCQRLPQDLIRIPFGFTMDVNFRKNSKGCPMSSQRISCESLNKSLGCSMDVQRISTWFPMDFQRIPKSFPNDCLRIPFGFPWNIQGFPHDSHWISKGIVFGFHGFP